MAHVRQSRPDSGLGVPVKVIKTLKVFPPRAEAVPTCKISWREAGPPNHRVYQGTADGVPQEARDPHKEDHPRDEAERERAFERKREHFWRTRDQSRKSENV